MIKIEKKEETLKSKSKNYKFTLLYFVFIIWGFLLNFASFKLIDIYVLNLKTIMPNFLLYIGISNPDDYGFFVYIISILLCLPSAISFLFLIYCVKNFLFYKKEYDFYRNELKNMELWENKYFNINRIIEFGRNFAISLNDPKRKNYKKQIIYEKELKKLGRIIYWISDPNINNQRIFDRLKEYDFLVSDLSDVDGYNLLIEKAKELENEYFDDEYFLEVDPFLKEFETLKHKNKYIEQQSKEKYFEVYGKSL